MSKKCTVSETVIRPIDTYNWSLDQFPVLEMKQPSMEEAMLPMLMENNTKKKQRFSNEQLEMLENSFQDDIKLEPDRKMKLARELGLQPRQIVVWFQNRRARWKGKQLERLYDALKQEYDAVSRDKQKLQQEVLALRAILKDEVARKQDIYGEETLESTSISSSGNRTAAEMVECNYSLNVEDYNNAVMMPPYSWANAMP